MCTVCIYIYIIYTSTKSQVNESPCFQLRLARWRWLPELATTVGWFTPGGFAKKSWGLDEGLSPLAAVTLLTATFSRFRGFEHLQISLLCVSFMRFFGCIKDYELKEVYQLGIFHSMAKATDWQGLLWCTPIRLQTSRCTSDEFFSKQIYLLGF